MDADVVKHTEEQQNFLRFSSYVSHVNRWHISAWTACSTSCGYGHSIRRVACKQKVKNPAEYMELDEDKCQQPKPDLTIRKCFRTHCPAEWVASEWGEVKPLLIS